VPSVDAGSEAVTSDCPDAPPARLGISNAIIPGEPHKLRLPNLKLMKVYRISAPNESGSQPARASREWTTTQPLLTPADSDQSFPVVYFLDNRVFQRSRMQLPKTNWTASPIIADYVGEPLSLALQYWEKVHWWMPIISKKRFYDHSLNPLVPRGVDVFLLLSTMKLILWHPGKEPRPATEYRVVRHALLEAENAGVLTLQLLQAKILLTIYEFGHAIYPAAYLSVGSCARFGTALGVNQCLQATGLSVSPEATLEIEEKKRSWWAVLMLDRFVSSKPYTSLLESSSSLVACSSETQLKCSARKSQRRPATYPRMRCPSNQGCETLHRKLPVFCADKPYRISPMILSEHLLRHPSKWACSQECHKRHSFSVVCFDFTHGTLSLRIKTFASRSACSSIGRCAPS
jgi:hypothetical protein